MPLHLPLSNDLAWFIVLYWFIVTISLVQNLTPIWEHFGFNVSDTLRTLQLWSQVCLSSCPVQSEGLFLLSVPFITKARLGRCYAVLLVASVLQTLIDTLPACLSNICYFTYYG